MQLLLQYKADIKVVNRKGRNALSFAVAPSMGRKTACDTLKLLLEHKADPNQKDEMGLTAKARAMREKRQDALAILEERERTEKPQWVIPKATQESNNETIEEISKVSQA